MKTQTDVTLIGLVLVVVAVIVFGIWSAGQVNLAAAQVGATAATSQLPVAAVIGGQVSGWALNTLIGIVALALATGLAAWVRQWWQARNGQRAWRGGPNAQWQGSGAREPRATSSDELMRMLMMQQMLANNPRQPKSQALPMDDELDIQF